MKTNLFRNTVGAIALASAGWIAVVNLTAQPMYDRIHVNLPYTVTLQNYTLQPGDYTIQQLPSAAGDSRILLFYSKDGMKFETSAMTIPALDTNTPSDTKVILNHAGADYYISKIWVQGKDYGYELPVPKSIRERQNERTTESAVSATYQPSTSTDVTTTTTTTTAAAQPAETAPPANANSNNTADTTNTPAATPVPTPEPTPAPVETAQTAPTPQPSTDNSADRSMDQAPADTTANRTSMPATGAGWLTMLLSGSTLSGAGLMLRRKR